MTRKKDPIHAEYICIFSPKYFDLQLEMQTQKASCQRH